jgi:carboxybiotin decarboxylase
VLEQAIAWLNALVAQSGLAQFSLGNIVMIAAGAAMIALALSKRYEPLLLVGVGFACIVANVPAAHESAVFHYASLGMDTLIIPALLALGVGAMTDFGPLIANPRLIVLGAGAQLGVVAALILAKWLGFTLKEAGAIGMIGGADGPLAVFVTAQLAPHLLGPVSLAAFAFLALMPMIQEAMLRMLPLDERATGLASMREPTRLERIAFPLVIALVFNVFFPPIAPLVTMLMLGNLLREVEATGRLAQTAAGGITNVAIIALTIAIGSTMAADKFLTEQTAQIALLGLAALACGVASMIGMAKLMNLFHKSPIPLPPAARQEHAQMIPVHHPVVSSSSGVFGAAILGGILLAALGVK